MSRARWLMVGLVLFLAAGIASGFFVHRKRTKFITEPVKRGSLTSTVEATGTVNPVVNIQIGAQVSGKIMEIYADYNARVRKGETIAQIDPAPYRAQVIQAEGDVLNAEATGASSRAGVDAARVDLAKARAALLSALARLKKDQAGFEQARKSYERSRALYRRNYISRSDLEAAEASYKSLEAALASDQAEIENARAGIRAAEIQIGVSERRLEAALALEKKARAALEQARANLSYTRITSPVDGIVVSRNVDVGQTVVSSFQAPNLFVVARDLGKMQVNVRVDEADIGKIKMEQPAKFTVDAYPDETFRGRVSQIRKNPITQQNVVTYDVIILVPNPEHRLLPGMTANASIVVAERREVLKVPNAALRFVPPEEMEKEKEGTSGRLSREKSPHVWVLHGKRPERLEIRLGPGNESETEVFSGIREGDRVVVGTERKNKKRNPFSIF